MLLIAALLLVIGVLLVLICAPLYHLTFYCFVPQYRQAVDEWRKDRRARRASARI
jgi:hypothetical protein